MSIPTRTERPITRGASILIVAPIGFAFDVQQVASSFPTLPTVFLPDPGDQWQRIAHRNSQKWTSVGKRHWTFPVNIHRERENPSERATERVSVRWKAPLEIHRNMPL